MFPLTCMVLCSHFGNFTVFYYAQHKHYADVATCTYTRTKAYAPLSRQILA